MAIDSVIFGFGYRAQSGKDTAVAEIIKQRGLIKALGIYSAPENQERYDIRRYAFADALKREVNKAALEAGGMENLFKADRRFALCNGYYMDFPDWVQYDPKAPMDDPLCPLGKQRSLLQFWGAEYRRAQDPDYWVRQLALQVELEKPEICLISDLRFPNEMEFVRQYGETVRVDRPGLPPSTHASETALDDVPMDNWSLILENSGTLEEFLEGAVTAFDELMVGFPFGHSRK
jgi:hypothetical protein